MQQFTIKERWRIDLEKLTVGIARFIVLQFCAQIKVSQTDQRNTGSGKIIMLLVGNSLTQLACRAGNSGLRKRVVPM